MMAGRCPRCTSVRPFHLPWCSAVEREEDEVAAFVDHNREHVRRVQELRRSNAASARPSGKAYRRRPKHRGVIE